MPRLISQGAARQFLASLPSVTLFDVGRRRQRFDTNGAAVVSLVMESGLSRQQADALAYLFHCGGKLSWVDLSYTKMKTRTFDALERRALVERYIERHDGSWCICGGYVVITSEGRDLVGEAAKSLGPLRSVQSESSGTSTIAPRSVVETATVYRNDRWKCFLSAANRYDHHITYVICTIGARADDETAKSAVDYYICEITSRNHIQSGATDFAVRAVVAIPCNRDEGGKVRRRRHPGDVDRMVCALQTSIDEMLNMQALPLDISKVLQKIRDEDASTVSGVPDSALRGRYLGIDGSDSRAKDIYRQCQRELNGEPRWTFTLMQMQDRVADHEGAISFSCAKIGIRRFWPSDSIELLTRIHP